jgi:predicted flap endonuclease-1-like 5' DNA nuclease
MSYNIIDIEGIGPAHETKFHAAGIKTTAHLLEKGGTKKGRVALAEATGISEKSILTWVNHSDLFRIKGIAGQFSELLEAAGVDTVKELGHRVPENLHTKLEETNKAKHLSGSIPSLAALTQMIADAKKLEPMVSY